MKISIGRASTTKKIPLTHGSDRSKRDKASVPSSVAPVSETGIRLDERVLVKWSRYDEGGWISADGRYRIESTPACSWLKVSGQTKWMAEDPRDCAKMANHLEAHKRKVIKLSAAIPDTVIRRATHVPDVYLTNIPDNDHPLRRMSLGYGEPGPYITLRTEDGRAVGHLPTIFTNDISTYIIGEVTLNSSVWIEDDFTGKGLGPLMYDLAEEITGLSMVPHGSNLVAGRLSSPEIERLWERRAQRKPVPGFNDPEVDERLAQAESVNNYQSMVRQNRDDPLFAAVVSRHTGWPVEARYVTHEKRNGEHTERFQHLWEAWCIAPDGREFSSYGYSDRRKHASDEDYRILSPEQALDDVKTKYSDNNRWLYKENQWMTSEEIRKYLRTEDFDGDLVKATEAAHAVLLKHAIKIIESSLLHDDPSLDLHSHVSKL